MPCYNTALTIVQRLSNAGHTAYFAGGWVRDRLMDHASDDIDIATSAHVEEVQALFPRTIPVGISFGIIVVVEEQHRFEVATFRQESGYEDGRRPTAVEAASPEKDAQRRDFTINGLFFDPLTDRFYDYVNGIEDIERKIIRAIGDPHHRFLEDRLRMIRAVRYAARFDFTIDPATIQAIIAHAKDLFPAVAIERVAQEFKKMANYPRFDKALLLLHRFGLLGVIFPSLKSLSPDALEERLHYLPQLSNDIPLIGKLYELFPGSPLSERLDLCDYLKLSKQDRLFTETLELYRTAVATSHDTSHGTPLDDYEWAQLYARPHTSSILELLSHHQPNPSAFLTTHQEKIALLSLAIARIQSHTTLVTAAHLQTRGIAPGPKLGQLLTMLERIAINNQHTRPEQTLLFFDAL